MKAKEIRKATPEEIKKIEDEEALKKKQQTGMMLQIISHKDGARSEPFIATWAELRETLKKVEASDQEELFYEDYILLVAIMDGEGTKIPTAPLITVETFLNLDFIGENNE